MRTTNFKAIQEHVSTQYGDLTGVIQIDLNSSITAIYDLCKDNDFDTTDKFIVGFGITQTSLNGIVGRDKIACTVLFLKRSEYGNSYDEIADKLRGNGNLKLHKKYIDIETSSLGKYIKRFDFLATTDLTNLASTVEIIENEEL